MQEKANSSIARKIATNRYFVLFSEEMNGIFLVSHKSPSISHVPSRMTL